MDFRDQLKQLSERVSRLRDQVMTEEATKTALVLPFLQCLGYDVFNPAEVVPEYVTDIGTKKGEKIDYAIMRDGQPVILIECKHHSQNLDLHDGQLLRYFHVSNARFGILTDGIHYRFYTDLAEPNKMDEKPFLEVDLSDIKENQFAELNKFHKGSFDDEEIFKAAKDLKYRHDVRQLFERELDSPSEGFVKYFTGKILPGQHVMGKQLPVYTQLTKDSLNQYISDLVTSRLKSALEREVAKPAGVAPAQPQQEMPHEDGSELLEPTEDEFEAFYIAKSILRQKTDAKRITFRPAHSYFSVLLDDNNRKPLFRAYLRNNRKTIGLFEPPDKHETKQDISSLDDIYGFANKLSALVDFYDSSHGNGGIKGAETNMPL